MLVDARIEHVEDNDDGSLMLDVVDGAGEVVQMYFLDMQAVKNFVEDVKLTLLGELNVESTDSNASAKRRCRTRSIFPGETIH